MPLRPSFEHGRYVCSLELAILVSKVYEANVLLDNIERKDRHDNKEKVVESILLVLNF